MQMKRVGGKQSLLLCIKCLLLCARIYLTSILLFMCMCLESVIHFLCICVQDWIDLVIAVSPPKEYEDEVYV